MLDFSPTSDRKSIVGASQLELEMLYSKHQLTGCIRDYFIEMGAREQLQAIGIPEEFGLDLLVQMALHKRATVATMTGILQRHFDETQDCADMIHKAIEEDLCDWSDFSHQIVVRHPIPDELQVMIDQFQYPLPMIEPPRPVTNNRQTGYRTIKKSVILKNNHHEDDVCLDHINRVNAQKLALNQDVVAFVQNSWKNLDRKKEGETDEEFAARRKAFEKYDRVSRDVLDGLALQGEGFWLTHAYDKRGRTYAQGYHVNYQGNDWNKGVVEFADAEVLNDE